MHLHTTDAVPAIKNARVSFLCHVGEVKRLQERHFRGENLPLAGNFATWKDLREAFKELFKHLHPHVIASINTLDQTEKKTLERSVRIELPFTVGWACLASKNRLSEEVFDSLPKSTRPKSRIVPKTRSDLLAPSTTCVVCTFRIRPRGSNNWECTLFVLRPELAHASGSDNEQPEFIIYPYGHPGEPLNTGRAST